MSIETAFLLGVLLGHWLMLMALWRASLGVLKILASMDRDNEEQSAANLYYIGGVASSDVWSSPCQEVLYKPSHHYGNLEKEDSAFSN